MRRPWCAAPRYGRSAASPIPRKPPSRCAAASPTKQIRRSRRNGSAWRCARPPRLDASAWGCCGTAPRVGPRGSPHPSELRQPPVIPMIERRPFAGLGSEQLGWLDTHYHFSFAQYRDPERMGWGSLRVWNDDEIAAGAGFPPHPHADMEIITYVRQGAVSHEDSLGNKGRTEAGDVQVISAGTGIRRA